MYSLIVAFFSGTLVVVSVELSLTVTVVISVNGSVDVSTVGAVVVSDLTSAVVVSVDNSLVVASVVCTSLVIGSTGVCVAISVVLSVVLLSVVASVVLSVVTTFVVSVVVLSSFVIVVSVITGKGPVISFISAKEFTPKIDDVVIIVPNPTPISLLHFFFIKINPLFIYFLIIFYYYYNIYYPLRQYIFKITCIIMQKVI